MCHNVGVPIRLLYVSDSRHTLTWRHEGSHIIYVWGGRQILKTKLNWTREWTKESMHARFVNEQYMLFLSLPTSSAKLLCFKCSCMSGKTNDWFSMGYWMVSEYVCRMVAVYNHWTELLEWTTGIPVTACRNWLCLSDTHKPHPSHS